MAALGAPVKCGRGSCPDERCAHTGWRGGEKLDMWHKHTNRDEHLKYTHMEAANMYVSICILLVLRINFISETLLCIQSNIPQLYIFTCTPKSLNQPWYLRFFNSLSETIYKTYTLVKPGTSHMYKNELGCLKMDSSYKQLWLCHAVILLSKPILGYTSFVP